MRSVSIASGQRTAFPCPFCIPVAMSLDWCSTYRKPSKARGNFVLERASVMKCRKHQQLSVSFKEIMGAWYLWWTNDIAYMKFQARKLGRYFNSIWFCLGNNVTVSIPHSVCTYEKRTVQDKTIKVLDQAGESLRLWKIMSCLWCFRVISGRS